MNPKTKLTNDQFTDICKKHDLIYISHERITTGFSHEVHKLNNDLVVKIYDSEYRLNAKIEITMLKLALNIPKPKFIATGNIGGRNYVIMTYIDGRSLGGMWHLANDKQRENLIKEICKALKTINQINPQLVNTSESSSWRLIMKQSCERLIYKLEKQKIITYQVATQTKRAINNYASLLNGDELCVVFWDIHFDNFIIDQNFQLQAVIDLENTSLTALDYPLFVLTKMMKMPHKYLKEDEEQYANTKDYVHLIEWYKKYYPEMFLFEHAGERLKFYQLRDVLHLLQDWPKNQESHAELARVIA